MTRDDYFIKPQSLVGYNSHSTSRQRRKVTVSSDSSRTMIGMIFHLVLMLVSISLFDQRCAGSTLPLPNYSKNIGHPKHRVTARILEDSKLLKKPVTTYPLNRAENKIVDDLIDDFDDQELESILFDEPSKREDEDYGHLRFGKRDDNALDYAHFRFSKRKSGITDRIRLDDNGNVNKGNDDDYGHMRFG